jgi:hypothetical protein
MVLKDASVARSIRYRRAVRDEEPKVEIAGCMPRTSAFTRHQGLVPAAPRRAVVAHCTVERLRRPGGRRFLMQRRRARPTSLRDFSACGPNELSVAALTAMAGSGSEVRLVLVRGEAHDSMSEIASRRTAGRTRRGT